MINASGAHSFSIRSAPRHHGDFLHLVFASEQLQGTIDTRTMLQAGVT